MLSPKQKKWSHNTYSFPLSAHCVLGKVRLTICPFYRCKVTDLEIHMGCDAISQVDLYPERTESMLLSVDKTLRDHVT